MHHIGMSTAPALYQNLGYQPVESFETIGLVTEVPMTIVARKDFEPKTLQELVTYVKANSGKVTLANAGIGAASHLCGLLFQSATGVKLQEVPYEGTGPALTDLVGGQVDFMCDQTTNTSGQITAGEVKAYAVTTPERVKSLPDLPTTTEGGLPDLKVSVWHGLYAPKGTPKEVVQKLSEALQAALADQKVIDQMAKLGTAPVPAADATPQAHLTKLQEQLGTWAKVIADAGCEGLLSGAPPLSSRRPRRGDLHPDRWRVRGGGARLRAGHPAADGPRSLPAARRPDRGRAGPGHRGQGPRHAAR